MSGRGAWRDGYEVACDDEMFLERACSLSWESAGRKGNKVMAV